MKTEQRKWTPASGGVPEPSETLGAGAQLVMVFGATSLLHNPELTASLKKLYPNATQLGCSTAGEICGTRVVDDSIVVTAIQFDHSQIRGSLVKVSDVTDSFKAGEHLAQSLPGLVPGTIPGTTEKLAHVLVLSDGLHVNGSELVRGLTQTLPEGVTVTGGMAGDGARFEKTYVFLNSTPESHMAAGLG